MRTLIVCASCERHVKPDDAECPFCGTAVPARAEPPRAPRGLSRAKLHAFHTAALATGVAAVALAASVASCGGTTSGEDASTDAQSNDAKAKDAVADLTFPPVDGQADVTDAAEDIVQSDVIPLPYGCVFPSARGCTSVTV